VNDQLHNPLALAVREETLYPLYRRLGGSQNQSGHFGEEKNCFKRISTHISGNKLPANNTLIWPLPQYNTKYASLNKRTDSDSIITTGTLASYTGTYGFKSQPKNCHQTYVTTASINILLNSCITIILWLWVPDKVFLNNHQNKPINASLNFG
jgi:hypothetical protein